MLEPLIDIQSVGFTYPARAGRSQASPATPALRGLSLSLARGEYLAVLGHNGSGKSTLARLCNALLLPDAGRVLVDGHDTADPTARSAIRDAVGIIFQNPDNQIIATLAEDDVAWGLAARGWPADRIRERVAWAMGALGIADLRQRAPQRLSGGQRQRLAIAGALALRPAAIIADESTSMLDPLARRGLVALLRQLCREHGIAILHVTHLLEEAAQADRVAVLEDGRLALEGPPAALFADLARLRRLRLAVPEPIELAARLRAAGLPIDPAALSPEAIAGELARVSGAA
ncbi:ATP-binding cassette domain-containing protein [Kouleothrix sp.]|uniref:ATP-binding cassette domain-containing protein n=1 Tax=Kouleothrix sp. TaxID=2779161 RepID=UPI00391C7B58